MKRVVSVSVSDALADRFDRYKEVAVAYGECASDVQKKVLEYGLDAAELTLSKVGLAAALEEHLAGADRARVEASERELLLLARAANCHDELIAVARMSLEGRHADEALLMLINEVGCYDQVLGFIRELRAKHSRRGIHPEVIFGRE